MTDPYTTPAAERSLLLTIDMQNDFVLDGAPACVTGSEAVVPAVAAAVRAFRHGRRPIIHVVRLYDTDGGNADACRRAMIESGARIVAPGSDGAELVAALKRDPAERLDAARLRQGIMQPVGPAEWVLYKPRWSAFFGTVLDDYIADKGIDTVVVCGCNFPNCPRSTIYDASMRDLRIVVLGDALSRLDDRGLREAAAIGVVPMATADLDAWLAI